MVIDFSREAWDAASEQEAREEEAFRLSSVAQLPQVPLPDEVIRFLSGEDLEAELDEDHEPCVSDYDFSDARILNL